MANREDKSKSRDFYQVLGLNKECPASELKNAYKKLALRWHPDRCSRSGNSKVEEAKQNFQEIQQAYSVLSDANKRFLYDVGAFDRDDDENGMGDFLNEMAVMMSQTKPNENGDESFEELQELFEELFQDDIESFGASCQVTSSSSSSSSSYASYSQNSSLNSKRNSSRMSPGKTTTVDNSSGFGSHFQKFSLGVERQQNFKKGKGARGGVQGGAGGSRMRQGRKQNVSSGGLNVSSSQDHGISA